MKAKVQRWSERRGCTERRERRSNTQGGRIATEWDERKTEGYKA